MLRRSYFAIVLLATLAVLFVGDVARAQVRPGQNSRRLITRTVDESKPARLAGNTRPEASATNDLGLVPDSSPIEHLQLQLQLPAEKEQELEQLTHDLEDPASSAFHHWLTPDQFRQQFSLAPEDIDAITSWLESHGFTVNVIYPRSIDFSGTAGQIRNAFKTEIHRLGVSGERHIANMSDPEIPSALAPAVFGVVSMNDFMPRPLSHPRVAYTPGNGEYAVVPADLATIYNFNPLFLKGITGQGQTIVVVEDTDVYSVADWSAFRSTLGLSGYTAGSFTQAHPAPPTGTNNCSDPGINGNESEAILDAEWASAGAPSANILLASCTDTTNFGGFIALQNILNASGTPPGIVSISYGDSEPALGAANNAYISALYQQAATEGVSVFVASGDEGGASTDYNASKATHGVTVSGYTSTPYNVSVGGTDFGDTYTVTNSTYWNPTNTASYGSAKSYIPEIPWNDSCAGELLATYLGNPTTYGSGGFCNNSPGASYLSTVAASGGPSGCATGTATTGGIVSGSCKGYTKPAWQSVFGNPGDGVRDIPDLSLFAANGLWGHYYVVCWSDTANGGAPCTGAPASWPGFGGTSFAAPIMASVQALINQNFGVSSGNPNPTYYSLAAAEYGAAGDTSCNSSLGNGAASTCIFYDVTQGDMDVNCTGTHNCYLPSGTNGVLSKSSSSYQPAFGTNTGWDFATGIGTVNVANLVNGWPGTPKSPLLGIQKTHAGSFTQGQQNALYTLTVSNAANAGPASGTVTVTEVVPSGLTLVSMAGTGWTCAASSCTRGDVLNAGSTYPVITVTVNVLSNASSPQLNQAGVSGGGSASASATDSTTINALVSGPTASFVSSDTITQGKWQSKYGSDAYFIAAGPQSASLSYGTFTPQNSSLYTWVPSTTDPRALTIPGGSGGIASCWYTASTFSFDVNLTDGNTHQIAVYALDWDNYQGGRAETVQIADGNTGTVLDSRNIASFTNGLYLIWNISGHVKINVILTSAGNAVVSGVFFGSANPTAPMITSANNTAFSVGTAGTFTVTASGLPTPALNYTGTLPSGVTFNSTTGVLGGTPATGTNGSYPLLFTASNNLGTNTQNFTLTVNQAPAGPSASFVGPDTSTEGNWQSKYGTDAYFIAAGPQSPSLSYGTFTPQNYSLYTWVPSTTDPRALTIPGGSGGIASCWYTASTFSFDVNLTDGKTHQIAVYALDWDNYQGGRAETVQIADGNTGTVLDTRNITSFTNGIYLIWNVSGHIKISVVLTGSGNAVVSGVFFGSANPTAPMITSANNTAFSVGTAGAFTVTASGLPTPTLSYTGTLPSGVTFNSTTGVLGGTPATGTNGSYALVFTANNNLGTNTQNFTLTVNQAPAGPSASYVGPDTSTEGNWQSKYGTDAYFIAAGPQSPSLSYGTFTPQNYSLYTWVPSTTDPRALTIPGGSGGIASCWYTASTFSFDANLTDGKTHQIAVYALDWDNYQGGRAETVQILDGTTGAVLDTRNITSFTNGIYLIWNISGHVKINVILTGAGNAVVSGVFFQ